MPLYKLLDNRYWHNVLGLIYALKMSACRMDIHNVIKVSDFGLSEDMYAKNYFRQDKDAAVKLPIKWMAPESLNDGIFTEKTDVVR